jgi:hypothetical protein
MRLCRSIALPQSDRSCPRHFGFFRPFRRADLAPRLLACLDFGHPRLTSPLRPPLADRDETRRDTHLTC